MKVITAVEQYNPKPNQVSVFLGGGITDCKQWQKEVINLLNKSGENLDNLIIYNPRRDNFPIDDPNASNEQIKWEFDYLMASDIFSMFFCGDTQSDQPICQYELGRYIPIKLSELSTKYNNKLTPQDIIIITSEPQYKRIKDVEIQSKLALFDDYIINNNLQQHVNQIIKCYKIVNNYKNESEISKQNNKSIVNEQKIDKTKVDRFINIGKQIINESVIVDYKLHKFTNINNVGLLFENKKFCNCNFNSNTLYGVIYKNCEFLNCNYNGSKFNDVIFESCTLANCSFVGATTNNQLFKNCKKIQCEDIDTSIDFDYINRELSNDPRFTNVDDQTIQVNIPTAKKLNINILKNSEVGEGTSDVSVYIAPKDPSIQQLSPLFITYSTDDLLTMVKQPQSLAQSFIDDINYSISSKYKDQIENAIVKLNDLISVEEV